MRSTGVHLVDGRCTLVVIDHDGVSSRVIDQRSVELPEGTIVGGRVLDPESLATHLGQIVGAARGHVVAAFWPDDALLMTIDCTDASKAEVGEAVDRVIVDRFGAIRPCVVLRKVLASGRELTTLGACRSADLESARRGLVLCGLDEASVIFAPAALAIFTRGLAAPTVFAVGGSRVGVLYGFAGWPFVGSELTADAHESITRICGDAELSVTQHRALRPPMARLGVARALESSSLLESVARELMANANGTHNGNVIHVPSADALLEAVTTDYVVALAASLWGASAVADLVPSGLATLRALAAVTIAAEELRVEPLSAESTVATIASAAAVADPPTRRPRGRLIASAAIVLLAVAAGAWWLANGGDDSATPAASTAVVSTTIAPLASTSASAVPRTIVTATTTPFVAQPHVGVYRQGKIYLEGTLPNRTYADAFIKKAAAVIGPQNVVDNYVIDPRAAPPSSGFVRVDEPFLFRTGSATLQDQYLGVLDLGVLVMTQNENVRIVVTGHTDSVGDEEDNQLLSVQRANAVINYMASKGVTRDRFDAVGKGETSPIADNATEAGRQLNRRIEVELLGLLDA